MKAINSVTWENDFLSLGNEFMDWGKKKMNEDTNLKISFLNCKNAIKLKDSECLKIFDEIWPMVYHRKLGECVKMFNNAHDSSHNVDGFGNASFRTVLKVRSQQKTQDKLNNI